MNENDDKEKRVQQFLELNRGEGGKLKIYLGMSAGVGKYFDNNQDYEKAFVMLPGPPKKGYHFRLIQY